jgi:hypothetical protein
LAAASAGGAALLLFGGHLRLAQLVVAMSAALGGVALVSFRRASGERVRAGLARWCATTLALFALAGHLYGFASYSAWLWALVALGLFAPVIASIDPLRQRSFALRFALAALLALVPIGVAAAIAYSAYAADPYH